MADNQFQGNYMEAHGNAQGINSYFPGTLKEIKQDADGLSLKCDNNVLYRIQILENGLLRFRFSPTGYFEDDFSYAIDPRFQPSSCNWEMVEFGDGIAIRTEWLSIRINRQGLKTTISEISTGKILCSDELGFHWTENRTHGGENVIMSKRCLSNEHFYGLGDKSCDLNMKGRRLSMWGSDTYGYGKDSDPLYKNIPFYISLRKARTYGIFFDNTFRTTFDFGLSNPDATSFEAVGGEMNYYFIYSPEPFGIVEKYTQLTGLPDMPPLWALGYHQCKWSYYPDAKVREISSEFRKRKIPCDAIYLDIDYMDGYRCFTWDAERFPDPKKLVSDLEEDGMKTVVMIDPGLKIDSKYDIWKEGFEGNHYCRRMDGALFKGSVWPGLCHFPDFTNPQARDWWATLYKGLIEDVGVHGVWNDMNEPAVFEDGTFPDDVRHDYDGHPCSHRKAHNVYGMQMVRASVDGIKRFNKGKRPLLITRSAYSGTQRYACAWTGDNIATWEHLRIANRQCQRLALGGMSFIGSDVGGFIEDPTPELYARWVQMAVFHPFFRTHSSGDHNDQEPWSFGKETEDIIREAIELRYELLPTLYTAFYQYATEGTPILKCLPLMAPEDPDAYWRSAEFGFGEHLYVTPISDPHTDAEIEQDKDHGRFLYLPNDEWLSYWTDQPVKAIERDIWVTASDNQIPIHVRAGAVLPHWPKQQYIGEIPSPEPNLYCWYGTNEIVSHWYEDDGDGYQYLENNYRYNQLITKGSDNSFRIERTFKGEWNPSYSHIKVTLRALPNEPSEIKVDGTLIDLFKDEKGRPYAICPIDFKEIEMSW